MNTSFVPAIGSTVAWANFPNGAGSAPYVRDLVVMSILPMQ
jgi:hypothetical protein